MKFAALLTPALLALAACGTSEPESAANAFGRTENEIAGRAQALNAQVENELSQIERRLETEAYQALNSLNAAAANVADEAAPAAAAGNKAREERFRSGSPAARTSRQTGTTRDRAARPVRNRTGNWPLLPIFGRSRRPFGRAPPGPFRLNL